MQGDFGKPRPAHVIRSDLYNDTHPSVTVLPLTSAIRSAPRFRITIDPSAANGLHKASQVMVGEPLSTPFHEYSHVSNTSRDQGCRSTSSL